MIRASLGLLLVVMAGGDKPFWSSQSSLPTPGFHHLHLNSINPEAAIDFYTKQFATTAKTTFAGQPALRSPNNVLVLFNQVTAPPATQPQTAFWHFGWHVTDVHKNMQAFIERGVTLLPLYTGDAGRTVFTSADTWPGSGGALGLTQAGIADAKARRPTSPRARRRTAASSAVPTAPGRRSITPACIARRRSPARPLATCRCSGT